MQKNFTRSGLLFLGLIYATLAFSQATVCPPNIGFELGNFNNWQCYIGTVSSAGDDGAGCPTSNSINATPSAPVPARHTIVNTTASDPFGGFPMCPDNNPVARLGFVGQSNAQIERISYTFTIPASATNFSLTYKYAVVYQDPGHCKFDQPHFEAKVYNVTTGEYVNCASFEYYASPGQNGFQLSPNTTQGPVWYKSWTPVTFILNNYAGQTIRIEFSNADCTFSAHWAYCYVDVMQNCNSPIVGENFCPGASSVSMNAPYGYQQYNWYNMGFGTPIATTQTLTVTPPPTSPTQYAVEIIPFPGFGCRDTIIATLNPYPAVTANAGLDGIVCSNTGAGVTIGSTTTSGYTYSWLPVTGLSDATISEPTANPSSTTQYIVTTTDAATGCQDTDTVLVTVATVSAAFTVNDATQCVNSNNFQFTPNNPIPGLTYSWSFGPPGAVSNDQNASYSYTTAGNYTVQLTVQSPNGCQDVYTQNITVSPLPTATISASSNTICEGSSVVLTATGSAGTAYNWFRDGVLHATTSSNTYNATQPGVYTFTLSDGCGNQGTGSVTLTLLNKPTASFDVVSSCLGNPSYFTNNSNTTGSGAVDYNWVFQGGLPNSSQANPVVNYTAAGNYSVSLTVTPQACPQLAATHTKPVTIEAPTPGMRYEDKAILENTNLQLTARSFGNDYLWSPGFQLNNPAISNPVFNGTGDQLYTITITTDNDCVTVDTQLVKVFKESNIYVPNAFSPNNDGVNDRFFPILVGIKELKIFRVMNRWGVVVFESRTDLPGWDGRYKGAVQPMGGFIYEVQAVDYFGKVLTKTGSFTLIR